MKKKIRMKRQITFPILLIIFITACSSKPVGIETEIIPTIQSPTVTETTIPVITATVSATESNLLPTPELVTKEVEIEENQNNSNAIGVNYMKIRIGDHLLTATLVENSSTEALKEALSEGPITINMNDYGSMEKVGPLGMDLPRNDEQITTEAGDVILYQGSALVIYYAPNSWNFTRLGKINEVSPEELREILGEGDVSVTLSLP